jgi:hypothetical protein
MYGSPVALYHSPVDARGFPDIPSEDFRQMRRVTEAGFLGEAIQSGATRLTQPLPDDLDAHARDVVSERATDLLLESSG